MRRLSKRIAPSVVLLLVILAAACSPGGADQDQEAVETVTVERGSIVTSITAVGSIQPGVEVGLSFELSGRVTEVLVAEGQQIKRDTALARLDTSDLDLQTKSVSASLTAVQAQLDQLLAGPRPEDVRAAEGQVASAQAALDQSLAQLEQVITATGESEVVVAQANVDSARSRVTQLERQLLQAQAQDPTPEVTVAEIALERAKITRDETQDEYNKALDRPWEDQSIRDSWAKQLEQAQLSHQQAQAQLESAQDGLRAHEISLLVLQAQIADARSAVSAAEAQLASAIAGREPTRRSAEANVAAAMAQRDIAQAQLDALLAGATESEIAIAQANVDQAQTSVDSVKLSIERATLYAPFEGTIASLDVALGQSVNPQLPVITLVDNRHLSIEADVDEVDIGWLQSGQSVEITLDAFPDRMLTGSVVAILPSGVLDMGVVSYKVTIALDTTELPLRPGMTANTEIVREQADDVIVVPNRAIWIDSKSGQPFVERVDGDETTIVYIKQGISNEEVSEVVSGLAAGDQLLVRSASMRDRFREVVTGSITGQ